MRQRILASGAPDTVPVSSKIAFRVCSIYSWVSQKFVPVILCSITFDRNFMNFLKDVNCSIKYLYSEDYIPQILTVLSEIHRFYI